MPEWTWLLVQAALTIIMVEQLRRRVLGLLNAIAQPDLILDVWGPLTLIIPMLFAAGRVDPTVRGGGWLMFGGPCVCAMLAIGLAMVVGGVSPAGARRSAVIRAAICCAGAALVLLLLGAAHELTLWMGQCAFAIAAVLLWINTPPSRAPRGQADQSPPTESSAEMCVGLGMLIALLCAVGQGVAAMLLPPEYGHVSGGIVIAGAAMSLASASVLAGPAACLRMGLWAAGCGILLGLGVLSLARLAPEAWNVVQTGEARPLTLIATGFGAYAMEAMAAGLAAALAAHRILTAPPPRSTIARSLGYGIIVLAAALAAWRLTAIGGAASG